MENIQDKKSPLGEGFQEGGEGLVKNLFVMNTISKCSGKFGDPDLREQITPARKQKLEVNLGEPLSGRPL